MCWDTYFNRVTTQCVQNVTNNIFNDKNVVQREQPFVTCPIPLLSSLPTKQYLRVKNMA